MAAAKVSREEILCYDAARGRKRPHRYSTRQPSAYWTSFRAAARTPMETCAWPSRAVAGCLHPVTGGWQLASESEGANEDATGGGRLPRTVAGRDTLQL